MDIYHVVIQCPETGKAVRTGVELTNVTAFGAVAPRPRACACEHCGSWHVWSQHDAWLHASVINPDASALSRAIARSKPTGR